MIAVLLALTSAVAYGVSDFLSGSASRGTHFARVAALTQVAMTAVTWAVVWFFGGNQGAGAVGWGLLAGLGSSVGTVLLYRGLGAGQMAVVAPLSAATAAIVPVAAGLLLGERPTWVVLVGVVVIVPAIWFISAGEPHPETGGRVVAGAIDGLLAGVAFAVSFIALDRAPAGGGLWPAAYAQLSALAVVSIAAVLMIRAARRRGTDRPMTRSALKASAAAGVLGSVAVGAFLLATGHGMLVVVSVLTALYPAVTVLLAMVVLRERVVSAQRVGLALAAAGVLLVVLG